MIEQKTLAAPLTGKASFIVGTVAGLLLTASAFVPSPWGLVVGWIGFIGCVLAGLVVKPPQAIAGRPLIQGGALTVVTGALGVLVQFYPLIPAGWPQGLAFGVAGILSWLAGVSLPALGHAPTAEQQAQALDAGAVASAAVDTKEKALDVLSNGAKGPPA